MSDEDIMQKLKTSAEIDCCRCWQNGENCDDDECEKNIATKILALINRQQERIEELEIITGLANGVVALPCKVGDMVYFVLDDFEEEPCIVSQRINEVGTRGIFVSDSLTEENCRIFVPYSDFGENVFLDKAEAERALKNS